MEKTLSYRAAMARPRAIRALIDTFILAFCSWPRLLIEVFTRRHLGERYFSFSSAVVLASFLLFQYPALRLLGLSLFSQNKDWNWATFLGDNVMLFGFVFAFIWQAIRRRREIKRTSGVFDTSRYSLSTGVIHHRLFEVIMRYTRADRRRIETLIEPGIFFVIGIILRGTGQSLGLVLMVSALLYGLSYRAMYRIGDDFVLDQIDKLIINKQMVSSFVDEVDSSQTQGFYFYGRRPADPDFRRELAGRMIERDEAVEAV